MVRELGRYNINVAALQETKWFGEEVYKVGGSIVISAGRPIPQGDQSRQRGEGVAIVLCGPAIDAWRHGGDQRKSWGSRLLKVTLDTGQKAGRLHVLSCYAPTYGSSREAKTTFFNNL